MYLEKNHRAVNDNYLYFIMPERLLQSSSVDSKLWHFPKKPSDKTYPKITTPSILMRWMNVAIMLKCIYVTTTIQSIPEVKDGNH